MTTASDVRVGIDLGALLRKGKAPGTYKMTCEQVAALLHQPVPWTWHLAVPESSEIPFDVPKSAIVHRLPGKRFSVFTMWTAGRLWNRLGVNAVFAPAAVAPICRAPIVSTYFDSNIFEHGWTWVASGRAHTLLFLRLLAWNTFRASRRVLTNSEYCRRQLVRLRPAYADRLHVNCIGVTPPAPPPSTPPAWAAALDGQPFFLCVGAFSENKGQRRLLATWALLQREHPDLPRLLLIGPCPPPYREKAIDPALAALPRSDHALYAGSVSNAELSWAFHHAAGYVQPSIAEGFSSFAVFEAMSCRVPVACSNSTSHPEGTAGAARLFHPLDLNDMAAAILDIWRNDVLRQSLVDKGIERVKQLTWDESATGVIQHLNAVL